MRWRFANRSSRVQLFVLIEAIIAAILTNTPSGTAASYSFVKIADGSGGFSVFNGASINNSGMVSFEGVRSGVAGIYAGNGGPITTIADTTGPFSDVGFAASINDGGVVAFSGSLDAGGKGIFTGSGGPTAPILVTFGPSDSFDPPSINNNNFVAYSAQFSDGSAGVYVSNGGLINTIASLGGTETFFGFDPPTINNIGTVAFLGYGTFGPLHMVRSGIYTGSGGALTPIATASVNSATFSDPSINDGGSLAYVRYNNAGPYSVLVSSGGISTPIVTTDAAAFGNFQSPSINSSGKVAFLGYLYSYSSTGDFGIFTGADPMADKVIQPGDPLFGSTVTGLDLSWGRRLNDRGEIAFSYALANGVKGIAVAHLVLSGDYNNSGVVDAADYVVWRKNQGTTNTLPNDLIGGTIGTPQYDQWRAHFGQTTGSGSGTSANAAVPEPLTLVLLLIAAVGWYPKRRRAA